MHLHAIPPHKVQKSPPLTVQSYTLWCTPWAIFKAGSLARRLLSRMYTTMCGLQTCLGWA